MAEVHSPFIYELSDVQQTMETLICSFKGQSMDNLFVTASVILIKHSCGSLIVRVCYGTKLQYGTNCMCDLDTNRSNNRSFQRSGCKGPARLGAVILVH